MSVDAGGFVALRRYYLWTTEMRLRFHAAVNDAQDRGVDAFELGRTEALSVGNSFQYMSYWFAGLAVVIEGWDELGLRDGAVDRLLENKANRGLLWRYRNGVYHYQARLNDSRFFDLIREGQTVVPWVFELSEAFGRALFPDAQRSST